MVEFAKSRLPEDCLFEALVETPKCLPDAVQLLTLCTIGNGRLRIVNWGIYALTLYDKFTGEGFRVSLDPALLEMWPEVKAWLLKTKPKKDQDHDRLFEEIRRAGTSICRIRPVRVDSRLLGKKDMGDIGVCPICREAFPVNDGGICRKCQGESPFVEAADAEVPSEGPPLKAVPVEDAVGKAALHDMTRIVPEKSKGPELKKGEAISAGDICRLQQMGRNRVYTVEDNDPGPEWLHEDEAVLAFAEAMAGDSITEAKRAMGICLRGLPRETRFNIVRFGSTHESLFKRPEEYGEKSLEKALRYTRRVDADMGGTEILAPLEAIYGSGPGKGAPARSIVMLTDGEVCNEQEIMDLIRRHRADTRFFSLGIGAGPNEFFIRGTARAGMGASEFIYPGERIEPKVLRIFKKLTGPFLENAVVRWGAEAGEQAPAEASVSLGDPLTLFNRLSGGASLPETITVSGRMDGVPCSWEVPVVRSEGREIPVPTLWARARIRDLEENKGALSGGGSRQRRGKQEKWKDQVLELSRAYGVLSGLTSFVAVEERREEDRTTGETVLRKVPTAVTVGWHGLGSTMHFGEIGSPAAVCDLAAPDEFFETPRVCRSISLVNRKPAPSGPPSGPLPMEREAREPDRTDILLSILALQRADGGLALDQIVSDILGLDFGKLRKEAEKMEAEGGEDRFLLLATAILLKVLEIRFAAERSTWEGVTQKSRDWFATAVDGTDPAIAGTALTAWAAAFVEEQVVI